MNHSCGIGEGEHSPRNVEPCTHSTTSLMISAASKECIEKNIHLDVKIPNSMLCSQHCVLPWNITLGRSEILDATFSPLPAQSPKYRRRVRNTSAAEGYT